MKKNSYHHGNLKEAIIEEAIRLLKLQDNTDLSFRLISRNIGVVSSAPYNHFKDKEHLLIEIISIGEKKLVNAIVNEKKKSNIPTEKLLLAAKSYIKFSKNEKALFNLMFNNSNKDLLYLIDKIVLQFEEIISEKFKSGKRVKLTEKGSAITAWSMIHGLVSILNNYDDNLIESVLNINLENTFKEMTAIWGKGVTVK
ncbi:MAG: hypothetical protein CMP40_00500 [Rickettsiales bacterium]|nr:hypothetical protein [Rickettsiales bacterium]